MIAVYYAFVLIINIVNSSLCHPWCLGRIARACVVYSLSVMHDSKCSIVVYCSLRRIIAI